MNLQKRKLIKCVQSNSNHFSSHQALSLGIYHLNKHFQSSQMNSPRWCFFWPEKWIFKCSHIFNIKYYIADKTQDVWISLVWHLIFFFYKVMLQAMRVSCMLISEIFFSYTNFVIQRSKCIPMEHYSIFTTGKAWNTIPYSLRVKREKVGSMDNNWRKPENVQFAEKKYSISTGGIKGKY